MTVCLVQVWNCRPKLTSLTDDIDNGSDEHVRIPLFTLTDFQQLTLLLSQVLHENQMLHQALSQSGTTSITTRLTEATRRKSEVQAKIAAGYMRLDPVFGNWLVSCWEAFTKSTEDGRNLEFASLDDYLAFRLDDVAAVYVPDVSTPYPSIISDKTPAGLFRCSVGEQEST